MGNAMDTEEGTDNHSRPTTLITAESGQKNPGASQNQVDQNPLIGVPIYVFHGDKCVFQPLNVPARNEIAHKSPALLKHAVAKAFQRQANKEGLYEDTDCVVHWKPSAIPFHIEFEFSVSNNTCQHLASVRNIKAKDPNQYAKNLAPLAKVFLSKPPESPQPHLPFTRPQIPSDKRSNRIAQDRRTSETVQHARIIHDQYNNLTEIDIKTAEATARMVNAGKILSSLLVYLTSPKPCTEDAVMSTEPPSAEDKGFQLTQRPFSAAPKRRKPNLSAEELQGPEPVLQHKREVSNPENDINGVVITQKPTLGENKAPKDTSTAERNLPEEPPAAMRSSTGKKASKKNNQGGKQILIERTRIEATSTISAYPTQRPSRKKRARQSITTKESPESKRLGSQEYDLEQVSATQPHPVEGSDHEENTPEQWLISEEALQNDCAFLELAVEEHEECNAYTVEEVLDPEQIATDVEPVPSDIVCGEDLITTADKPALSIPTTPTHEYGGGVQGLLWAYAMNTEIDETVDDAGIWLWRKPKTYFRAQSLLRTDRFRLPVLAPVVISHKRTGNDEPIIEYDGDTVHIVPREQHWEDVRSRESHPDFLIPWKLTEYQASEAAGYQVWRHDRDLLKCRKPGCDATVSDYHHSAVVCLGCGPKSFVRYCSLQHQLEDIEGHWKECGTWRIVLKRVIDHTTAPSKFARMCPAIKQRHGSRTAALQRQMFCCALTYGHYTLFDSASNRSETLCWSKQDPKWPEMDRRIERLINVAFLDSWNHYVLGYLYRLLRELLRCRGKWSESTERLLKSQLEAEFSDYKVNTNWHNGDAPCQCEWSGRILPRYDHLSTCRDYAPIADDYGPVQRQKFFEAIVEDYEERFWILRAWRQQHPTQSSWRLRAAGFGFPDTILDEECYDMGPGWIGWGGEKDNICEDQGRGEKRSMRSA